MGGGWRCSRTNIRKLEKTLSITENTNGRIKGFQTINDCGTIFSGEVTGLQTSSGIYLYGPGSIEVDYEFNDYNVWGGVPKRRESSIKDIAYYSMDRNNEVLKKIGTYKLKNGVYKFEKTRQNNESWTKKLISKKTYKTTYFVPETSREQVVRFNSNIQEIDPFNKERSGFQWGKALALGAGAVAGGGLSLDSDTQASVIAGIVLDSQANTSGTSNLNDAVQTSLETNAQRAAASTSLPENSKSEATANQSGSSYSNAPNSAPTSDAKATAKNSQVCLKEAFDLRTRYSILTVYCEGKIEGTTESRGYRHRLVATPVIMTEWPTAKNLSIRREANDNAFQKLRQSLGNIHNGAMAERSVSCSASESFSYQNNTATYEQALNSLSQVQEHHRSRQISLSEAKERGKNAFTLSGITITPNEMNENQAFREFEAWLGNSNSCDYAERLRNQK